MKFVFAAALFAVFIGCASHDIPVHSNTIIVPVSTSEISPAPNFELTNSSGTQISLGDYKGKVVILNFFATWCRACIAEMPMFENLMDGFKNDGLAVIAVGTDDDCDAVERVAKEKTYSFPVVCDSSHSVQKLYKTSGVPTTFLIDRDGHIVSFVDPLHELVVSRIEGARSWDSPSMVKVIQALLIGH